MPRYDWEKVPEARWQKIARQDPIELWNKATEAPPGPHSIRLGTSLLTGVPLYTHPKDLSTHMQIVGATGVGKSFFLEGILKRLIEQGHGVCLITPHEDIYQRLLSYCARVHFAKPQLGLARRVIPVDISNTRQILGFNPVARNARVMTYQVVALMDAIRKCWGQGSFQETPRLARWLYNTGYAVVESNLTLLQARHLVDSKVNPLRQAITRRVRNPDIRGEWEWIMAQKTREQDERLESSFNRIREFVGHEIIRLIIGQHTKTIDFPSVLREGKILLVNLSRAGIMGESNQELLGTLLVNELLTAAFARREEERRSFFLCIDEFQHFASKDICEILDGGRKFGLHLILAHQLLNQLRAREPEVYYSTLTNARTKVVFGGLMEEDLDIMAKEIVELNPNEIKHEIWQTKFEPAETTRTITTNASSESYSKTEGESSGEVSHESLARGDCYIPGSYFLSDPSWQIPAQTNITGSSGSSRSSTSSSSSAYNYSSSTSTTEVPWYEYHKFQELSSVTFSSLEEQLYIKKRQLKRQPRQHAAILIPDRNVELVSTPTLRDFKVSSSQREEFLAECFESAGCFKTPKEAEREVIALEESLLLSPRSAAKTEDDDSEFFDSSLPKV